MVRAAVRVVFPWSTWPMVPMLTWGFFLSNLPLAARTVNRQLWLVVAVVLLDEGGRKRGVNDEERANLMGLGWKLPFGRRRVLAEEEQQEEEDCGWWCWYVTVEVDGAEAADNAMVEKARETEDGKKGYGRRRSSAEDLGGAKKRGQRGAGCYLREERVSERGPYTCPIHF
ncbi:hypothetical protein Nepgr_003077 [Nepenthes gracilis]|uniref:Uncharacterized protein n=1 Tax=Nepenthes gracilis TaxID=150966 RepID=A0AAD3RYU9_NEPGR|nr:hypothetical protein Nepgr_003077 [Nepenthes gracilis]